MNDITEDCRGQNQSRTYSVEPFGLEDVSIHTIQFPPPSCSPPVDTPCNTQKRCI